MTVSRRSVLLLGAAGALAGCSVGGVPRYDGAVLDLRIAGGEPGGLYNEFAQLLAGELGGGALRPRALPTDGSVDNVGRLAAGSAELGMVLADTALAAAQGRAGFVVPVGLLALAQTYQNYMQLFCRSDAALGSVGALRGRTVSLGSVGSGAALFGRRMLTAAGLVPGRDVTVVNLGLAAAVAALRERTVDASLFSAGLPIPSFAALAVDVGLRLVPMDDLLLGGLDGYAYDGADVPPGTYGSRQTGVRTVGVANLLLTTAALPDAVAEEVVRTLIVRAPHLVPLQTRGRQLLSRRTMIDTAGIALHPGAVRAYRSLHG